jgi:hypothetical protein
LAEIATGQKRKPLGSTNFDDIQLCKWIAVLELTAYVIF